MHIRYATAIDAMCSLYSRTLYTTFSAGKHAGKFRVPRVPFLFYPLFRDRRCFWFSLAWNVHSEQGNNPYSSSLSSDAQWFRYPVSIVCPAHRVSFLFYHCFSTFIRNALLFEPQESYVILTTSDSADWPMLFLMFRNLSRFRSCTRRTVHFRALCLPRFLVGAIDFPVTSKRNYGACDYLERKTGIYCYVGLCSDLRVLPVPGETGVLQYGFLLHTGYPAVFAVAPEKLWNRAS